MLLAALVTLIYFFYGIFSRISHPQLMTETTVTFDDDDGVPFPSVTICNDNQVRQSFANENPIIKSFVIEWFAGNTTQAAYLYADTNVDISQFNLSDYAIDFDAVNLTHVEALFAAAAHPLSDFVRNAYFHKKKLDTDAYEDDFKVAFTDLGVCYTFKGYSRENARRAHDVGPDFGLTFEAFLNTSEFYFGVNTLPEEGVTVSMRKQQT